MSAVEYNLLRDRSVAMPPHQLSTDQISKPPIGLERPTSVNWCGAERDSYTGTEEKPDNKDILKRVTTRDLCMIARHLATLLRAGMPLVPALSALVEQLQKEPHRKLSPLRASGEYLAGIMQQVADRVNSGSSLSYALSRYPTVFSGLFVNMVAAGEASGTLEEILLHLAEMLEKRAHLASKVKSAVAYPLMMVVVATGVVTFLLSFVVPNITQIFLETNQALPWPTRLLISTSSFMKTYFLLIVIIICALCCAIAAWMRTKKGRFFMDRSKLRVPIFGKLFLKLEIARLTRTLGTLLLGGVPILAALEVAKGVVQNSFIAAALDSIKDLVSKGDNVADAVRKAQLFPPVVFHIIATGQASGSVEYGLLCIADMYDSEVELTAKTLASLLEPMILLVMGAVVGFIVMAILLPIFQISQVL